MDSLSHRLSVSLLDIFFFNDTATTEIYTLSLHDALPIWTRCSTYWYCSHSRCSSGDRPPVLFFSSRSSMCACKTADRSEEHTSELQSRQYLVCRLLLEKKKKSLSIQS